MRLIDADALVKALNESGVPYRADVQEVLDAQPTVDAVPVVRCKDCRHWSEMQNLTGACLRHSVIDGSWWHGTDSTDYCSFAERRNDE